jgi:tetratricopeptide (TPR) repeat protein
MSITKIAIEKISEREPFLLIESLNEALKENARLDPRKLLELIKEVARIDARKFYHKGNTLYEKGDYENAINNYTAAIVFNPSFSEAYFNKGLCYYNLKEFDLAIGDYTLSSELDPKNPVIYNNRGDAYYRKQNFIESIKNYNLALALNSKYLKAYYNRGLAYACGQAYKLAVKDFDQVIKLNSNFSEAYHIRGLAYDYLNDLDKAIEDYDKAIELNPSFSEAIEHRNIANEKRNARGKYQPLIIQQPCKYTSNENLTKWLGFNDDFFSMMEHVIHCDICKNRINSYEELRALYKDFSREMNWTFEKGAVSKHDSFHGECGFVLEMLRYYVDDSVRGNNYIDEKMKRRITDHIKICKSCRDVFEQEIGRVEVQQFLDVYLKEKLIENDGIEKIIEKLTDAICKNPHFILPDILNWIDSTKQSIVGKLDASVDEEKAFYSLIESYRKISSFFYDSFMISADKLNEKGDYHKSIFVLNTLLLTKPDSCDAYILKGEAYSKLKGYLFAFRDFSKAKELNSKNYKSYSKLGDMYLEKEDFNNAIEEYDKALMINHKNSEVYYNRGNAYSKLLDYEKAIEDYGNAMKYTDKKSSSFFKARGDAYYSLNRFDKAIDDYNEALKLLKDSRVYCSRGNAYYSNGKYNRAIEDYDKAIYFDPKDSSFYNARGNAYFNLSSYDRAIADYSISLELSKDAIVYINRGNAYYNKGLYDNSMEDYNNSIELNPQNPDSYGTRGNLYFEKGFYDNAIEDYSKSIKVDQQYQYGYNGLGYVYLNKGVYDKAIENLNKAIELDPYDELSAGRIGLVYFMQGQIEKALEQLNNAISMKKSSMYLGFIYLIMIRILIEKNDKELINHTLILAEQYLENQIEKNPNDSTNYSLLAMIYCEVNAKLGEAIVLAHKAVNLLPDYYNIYVLAFCNFRKGDAKSAIECFEKSLKLNPSYTQCYLTLGKYYVSNSDNEKAKQIWNDALKINPKHRLILAELEKIK